MLRINKRIISIISAIAVSCSLFIYDTDKKTVNASASTVNSYGLATNTKDGTILHAFSWSFNTIRSKMKEIADCGYSAIQVSPIEGCNNGPGQHTWEWENTYKPNNYRIGNYVVGSRDEFKALCSEAEQYGIKIIVDVVANHINPDWNQVDSELKQSGITRNYGEIGANNQGWEWKQRWALTQKSLMGMPDLVTQSDRVQNIIKRYLDDCIDCGADGFRFDTTKHIELPKSIDGDFGGDFWPNIVNEIKSKKSDAFVYGEVLQDEGDAYYGYSNYLGLTADAYGSSIRNAINNHNIMGIGDYCSAGVSADKLVTYSETHDTYANNGSASSGMNEWQVRKGYEIVAARAKGTPLFLARPKSTGRTNDGYKKLEGPLGVPQNDWNNPEVKAVNKFHNAMIGKSEYIRKLNNETIAIERGTEGMVIVNLNGGFDGYIDTFMSTGTYKEHVSGKDVTVQGGRIHVNIPSGQTAVIYNDNNVITGGTTGGTGVVTNNKAYLRLPSGWTEPYVYIYEDNGYGGVSKQNATWPGVKMTKVSDGLYEYDVDASFTNPLVIFNDNNHQYPASGERGLSLSGSMILSGTSWSSYTSENPSTKKIAYIKLPSGWNTPYAYVYEESNGTVKTNASWPGVQMTEVSNGLYKYEVDSSFSNPLVIFNDRNNQYPGSGQQGLSLSGSMIYSNGAWSSYTE